MTCDIIIPTYNSAATITSTLDALTSQFLLLNWQCHVVVSDDGSNDNTVDLLKKRVLTHPWQLTILSHSHAGAGQARQRALAASRAEVIFLLGADILLRPGVLQKHLLFHERHPALTAAALGMVRWDPRLPPSPLMEWMVHGGQQNDFDSLVGHSLADPAHAFYGSHVSLKGELLRSLTFSPATSGYGWEDFDLGRRLQKRGLKLHVLSTAVGLHHHAYAVAAIKKRQQAVGYNLKEYAQMYPDVTHPLRRSPANHLRRILWVVLGGQLLLEFWLKLTERTLSFPRLFLVFTATEFWKGVWRREGGFLAFLRQNRTFYS